MRNALNVLVTVMCATAVFFAGASGSFAHSDLVASSPAQGSVNSDVASISLSFGEEVVPEYTSLALTAQDGLAIELEAPTMDATNTIVSANVIDGVLSDGAYVVGFYIVSIDGHPIKGSVTFEVVGSPAPNVSATPTAESSASPTDESTDEPTAMPLSIDPRVAQSGVSTGVEWVWIGTGIATVVVLGAVSAVLLVALRRRRDSTY